MSPILVEVLRLFGAFLAAITGGGLVILGAWLADRRKQQAEDWNKAQRERTLLTGMTAVRNHIAESINAFDDTGRASELHRRLRTAKAYVQRFVEKTPDGSEAIMIAVLEVGLKLDSLLAALERPQARPSSKAFKAYLSVVIEEANGLLGALGQFDIIAHSHLAYVSEDDLKRWGAPEEVFDFEGERVEDEDLDASVR